uniref:Plug domain-containing protein n=2 Tax=cellular organisms TaxID=131567 RepID=A0A1I8ACX3_9BILA
ASSTASSVELDATDVKGVHHETFKVDNASSPKFTAPLRDTPKSVTIINEALIKERGATSLTDVLRTTPGITLGAGEGGTPLGDRPFIRGFEASTDIQIDGLRDLGRASHEAFNIETVEIVKGPGS